MPPSPAMKCSPGRELRGGNHKRGRSFESGILLREKDDDLALFNEMQTKEKESFLLQSSDDFEDTFSTKLRYFSDFKLGISIPVRRESSDLLNADGEKNDYDWLLTPPDTPLFPSLDDEPAPVHVARKSRPQSQPISISRSSTMEKSYRSSRGSPSPNRLSPSPRSGNSSFQPTRGRPSSAPQSSGPTPALQSTIPTRRPSPPPSKPYTPAPRSSTPTPRRISTGSRGTVASSSARGTSPIRTSRGNSASPKIRAWQSNIPGFSLEAPPNLRTSLADRPASYVRGSSPASKIGKDSTSKFGRQSMSPTTSRSVSSSHSHDRDRFSSQSKGSLASSGDDDMDSLQSVTVGGSDYSVSKRVGAFANNRTPTFSKKSASNLSTSAPKRSSFDSALRQMDYRRIPQKMFRPLLSSVPSSTFIAGKSSSNHYSMISRNSSVTTSSNTSSDQGTSVAHEAEGSDHFHDVTSDRGKVLYPEVQEEVFAFDKVDPVVEEAGLERHDKSSNLQLGDLETDPSAQCHPNALEEFIHHGEIDPTSNALSLGGDSSEVGCSRTIRLCPQCGIRCRVIDRGERNINQCPDCRKQNDLVTITNSEMTIASAENSSVLSMKISEDNKPVDELEPPVIVPELQSEVSDTVESRVSEAEENDMQIQTPNSELSQIYLRETTRMEEGEQRINYPQEMGQPNVVYDLSDRDTVGQQLQLSHDHLDVKVDTSEGAGISLLLNMSKSGKGLVVQGRTFTATNIPYEDLSYARNCTSSLKSPIGHESSSASSSTDFSSSRHTGTCVNQPLSGRKYDMENYRCDVNIKPQNFGLSISTHENSENSAGDMIHDTEGLPGTSVSELLPAKDKGMDVTTIAVTDAAVLEEGIFGCKQSNRTMDALTLELSSQTASVQSDKNSVALYPNYEDRASCKNGDDIPKIARSTSDLEASVTTPESSCEEENIMSGAGPDGMEDAEVHAHSSLATITEIEIENICQSPLSLQMGDISPRSTSITNECQDPSAPTYLNKDMKTVPDPNSSDIAHGILDKSTLLVDSRGGSKARSLTLEEATDAMLFCSSIVHDIASQAATIAMDKEGSRALEGSWPTVTILGKSNSDRKNPCGRTVGKQTSKPVKARPRREETKEKPPLTETENDENADESMIRNVGLPNKGDNLKPPKLESKCNCTIM